MYAVVGCSACSAFTIVEGDPETTQCPRCRKRLQFRKLKKFVETEDVDHARDVRSRLLAERSGASERATGLDSFATMEPATTERVVADDEYLEGAGIDAEEVAAAGETEQPRSVSARDVVRDAIRELEAPTAAAILEYARERGVARGKTESLLEKFRRDGLATVRDGHYRLVE